MNGGEKEEGSHGATREWRKNGKFFWTHGKIRGMKVEKKGRTLFLPLNEGQWRFNEVQGERANRGRKEKGELE